MEAAAALAEAAKHHVVLGDFEADLARDPVNRPLQGGVLEGDHAAATTADRVVVVAAGLDPLVARGAVGHLKALNQAKLLELLELLEGAIDAGSADPGTATAQLSVDLCG